MNSENLIFNQKVTLKTGLSFNKIRVIVFLKLMKS